MSFLCFIGIHNWNGCECIACSETRHDLIVISEEKKTCSSCGGSGSITQKTQYQNNYGTNGPDYSDLDPDAWETVNCSACSGTGKETIYKYKCKKCRKRF